MSIPVAQLSYPFHSKTGFSLCRRSPFRRLSAPFAGLWRRLTEHNRLRRDQRHLEQMTDHELKDIGLRRAGPRQFHHIGDAEGG
ncbi:DUF1127 domain-containing protein [Inquilinus sp. CA228]|uniref:DUF1127 domain-containing protein n=1 Tax=Inquilinus sp. CA228 TaxID=3455609 RepID=UPI003F8D823A